MLCLPNCLQNVFASTIRCRQKHPQFAPKQRLSLAALKTAWEKNIVIFDLAKSLEMSKSRYFIPN